MAIWRCEHQYFFTCFPYQHQVCVFDKKHIQSPKQHLHGKIINIWLLVTKQTNSENNLKLK